MDQLPVFSARTAFSARIKLRPVPAVNKLRVSQCHRELSNPFGARKKLSMTDPAFFNTLDQTLLDGILPDDFLELHEYKDEKNWGNDGSGRKEQREKSRKEKLFIPFLFQGHSSQQL